MEWYKTTSENLEIAEGISPWRSLVGSALVVHVKTTGSKVVPLLECSMSMEAKAVADMLGKLSPERDCERLQGLYLIVLYVGADYRIKFAEENFATLLYACLKCMKEGLPEEIVLATRALSPGYQVDELYEEALPLIHQSRDDPILLSAINLIAVCAFVSEDFFVTEAAMEKIWGPIRSIDGVHVLSAAIAAWSFVLASTDPYNLPHWITRYTTSTLLEYTDESVHTATDDAFKVLLEKGSPRRSIWSFEDGVNIKVLMIGKYGWKYSSCNILAQVEFVLNFLGSGFTKDMLLGNKYLQYVFNFTPEDQEDDGAYYVEIEEVSSAAIAAWSLVLASTTNPYVPHWTSRLTCTLMENTNVSTAGKRKGEGPSGAGGKKHKGDIKGGEDGDDDGDGDGDGEGEDGDGGDGGGGGGDYPPPNVLDPPARYEITKRIEHDSVFFTLKEARGLFPFWKKGNQFEIKHTMPNNNNHDYQMNYDVNVHISRADQKIPYVVLLGEWNTFISNNDIRDEVELVELTFIRDGHRLSFTISRRELLQPAGGGADAGGAAANP